MWLNIPNSICKDGGGDICNIVKSSGRFLNKGIFFTLLKSLQEFFLAPAAIQFSLSAFRLAIVLGCEAFKS